MGFVLHLLLAFGSLTLPAAQWAAWAPVRVQAGIGLGLFAAGAYLIGWAVRWCALRGRPRSARLLERVLVGLGVVAQWTLVGLFSWRELVGIGTAGAELLDWPGPALLLALVPYLAIETLAVDARARLYTQGDEDLRRVRTFQLRLLLSALVPFALYLGLSGLVGAVESWRVRLEEVELLSWAFTVLLLLGLVLLLPRLLTFAWDTVPLEPGALRTRLEALAARTGLRYRELLVWRTGRSMANAAVVGFTPRSRVVLFSDSLLARLSAEELEAVFAHEIGHVRCGHARGLASFAVGAYFLADLVTLWIGAERGWTLGALLLGLLVLWGVGMGYLSRRYELEADLESLRWTEDGGALVRALWKVGGAGAYHRGGWRHFSSARRAEFLAGVVRDPALGERLRRQLRRFGRLGVVFVLATGIGQASLAGRRWDGDQMLADLRLGHYEAAAERFERGARPSLTGLETEQDPERLAALERLLETARGLPAAGRTAQALEGAAQVALREGRDERALDLLQLAYLRGRSELADLIRWLERRFGVSMDGAEAFGGELSGAWRSTLERRFGGGPSGAQGTRSEEAPSGGFVPPAGG